MKQFRDWQGGKREALSLFCFLLSFFLWAAFFSFQAATPSHNLCGPWGGRLAQFFLDALGLCAFLYPLSWIALGVALYRWLWSDIPPAFWFKLAGFLGLLVTTSLLLALQAPLWLYSGDSFLPGGAFGAWVAHFLVAQLNVFGSSLLVLFLWLCLFSFVTPFPLVTWILKSGSRTLQEGKEAATSSWKSSFNPSWWRASQKRLQKCLGQLGSIWKQSSKRIFPLAFNQKQEAGGAFSTPISSFKGVPQIASKAIAKEFPREPLGEATLQRALPIASQRVSFPEALSQVTNEAILEIIPPETSRRSDTPLGSLAAAIQNRRSFWQLPEVDFLKNPPSVSSVFDQQRLMAHSQILKQKFSDFGIEGEVTAVRPGPVITLYEFKPGPGVKVSRIAALADDLSMALSAESVRILAPLPGKSVVGIEIPSEVRETVYLREFLQHPDFYGTRHAIPVIMGKEIGGQPYLSDLARMPHLLCAGQTGSGKSVFMTGLICSLLYRFTPEELRLILVDPKFIEFRAYQDLPHLLLPVVDDAKQASLALKWAVREMERRYRILAQVGARNLASFHQKLEELGVEGIRELLYAGTAEGESGTSSSSSAVSGGDWLEAFEPDNQGVPQIGKLPYIVIIIDELADLMMIAKKEVEISIARIAQKARAAGIHLIIATQRPSTDVITGLIKANLPSRVSFQLASYIDSKTILDRSGAERLLGQGDMLFVPPGVSQLLRLHGAYVDDEEIQKITLFLKSQGKPRYRNEILLTPDSEEERAEEGEQDPFFEEAVDFVKRSRHASASALQRQFKIGYNRAARLIEEMESRGWIGPQEGARPREILLPP